MISFVIRSAIFVAGLFVVSLFLKWINSIISSNKLKKRCQGCNHLQINSRGKAYCYLNYDHWCDTEKKTYYWRYTDYE